MDSLFATAVLDDPVTVRLWLVWLGRPLSFLGRGLVALGLLAGPSDGREDRDERDGRDGWARL